LQVISRMLLLAALAIMLTIGGIAGPAQ